MGSTYMKFKISKSVKISFFFVAFTIFQAVMIAGCTAQRLVVISHNNDNLAVLCPEDVVAVMRRASFSDEQIEQLGPKVRDALAFHGACRIKSGDRTEALFLTQGNFIYVAVRGHGNFFYKTKNKNIR